MRKALAIGLVGLALVLAYLAGYAQNEAKEPVCHSVTEDSVMSDCFYQNGAWYRK